MASRCQGRSGPILRRKHIVLLVPLVLSVVAGVAAASSVTGHTQTSISATFDGLQCGTTYTVSISPADSPQSTLTETTDPCPNTFYVSPSGNNTDGTSWANAWTNTSKIDWAEIHSGATIYLDGGSSTCTVSPYDFSGGANDPGVTCGQAYAPFTIGQDDVTVTKSSAAGRNGTVVIDGGRNTPLPYCAQSSYSADTGAGYGIDFGSHTGVVIDGLKRSGIIVRGAQNGVRMGPGGNDTLRNMEVFDNGTFTDHSTATPAWGYSTNGNGVVTGGTNNVYDRMLVHDNGQDEFHSDGNGYDQSGSSVTNSWMGAMREHPTYTGEPFNDTQVAGANPGCTHADAWQSFAPAGLMNGLTFDYDVFGPGINQGVYANDRGTGTAFTNVLIKNSLFLDAASHNIEADLAVTGWTLDHDTIFATQGGFEIPNLAANTITNTIKQGGYVYTPGGTWTTSGNDWWEGNPLPGTSSNTNPNFASVPTGTLPSLPSLRSADLTSSAFPDSGSPLHSFSAVLSRIDSLNG